MSELRMKRTVVAIALSTGALALAGCSAQTGASPATTVTADPVTVTKTVSSTVKVTTTAPASTVTAAPVTVTEPAAAAATTESASSPAAAPATSAPAAPAPADAAGSGMSASQRAAVRSAQSYLEYTGFSRQGLIDQLSSEYGEKFSVEDATAAVDSLTVDWNAEAAQSAKSYTEFTGMSCQGMIDQLSSEYGSQFTQEQAQFGATSVGLC